jgi:hypothetical protein
LSAKATPVSTEKKNALEAQQNTSSGKGKSGKKNKKGAK